MLSPDYPRTVAEAVDWLESVLPDGDKKKLAAMAEDDLNGLHFGLGLFVRNSLQVWRNEPLMKDAGVSHEDDVSAVVIEALWRNRHAGPTLAAGPRATAVAAQGTRRP
jgi:hypothetical protein